MSGDGIHELNDRVLHIERELSSMKLESATNRAELSSKITALGVTVASVQQTAESTKADTSEMVALLKGMKLLGALTKWVGLPGGVGGVIYVIGGLRKWW